MTVGLVALSVAAVAALVVHEAGIGNASASTTVTPTTTTNNSTTSGGRDHDRRRHDVELLDAVLVAVTATGDVRWLVR